MLVLSRRIGEEIVIADHIRVRIAAVRGKSVRLAFSAPDSVNILREEVYKIRRGFDLGAIPTTRLGADLSEVEENNLPDVQFA